MAERVELCDKPQGDHTPCIILHREHDDPSLPWLNHTSATVLLDDYAELDRREVEVRALREALRWAFTEWGEDWEYDEHTDMPKDAPEHECRYGVAPDEGYCLFCDEFWKAYLRVFTPSLAPEPPASG